MVTLSKAHQELFRRTPDECFDSLDALYQQCLADRESSSDQWVRPQDMIVSHDMTVAIGDNPDLELNDWSFSQLCRMAGVSKDTINRLSSKTASRALEETLPRSEKPVQFLTTGEQVRSVHGVSYTRLWNVELLSVVKEFATDFSPPQKALDGTSTGLYCGEQDLFAFLIDPAGWTEIGGEAFAPGFFLWNSEVGRRSLGIQTFWFQRICQNHLVWDAVEVVEFSRKHTAKVHDGLNEIRRAIEQLVAKRDQRRDGFVEVIRKAMIERLGSDAEQVTKLLSQQGIPKNLIKESLEIAQAQGGFTIFSLVDALTKLSQRVHLAGDRAALDTKIGQLLSGTGSLTMDPQATWEELLQAWLRGDWESVVEYAEALLGWLDRGGFPPEILSRVGVEFNWTMARSASVFARRRAQCVLDDPHRIPHEVPFTLTCSECNCQGPESSSQAWAEGWQHVEHVPTSASENFLGICPICLAESCWADPSNR